MEAFYQAYKDKKLRLFRINIKEGEQKVRDYAREQGLHFPILLDSNGEITSNYGIRSHPTAYFIGPKGEIMGRVIGARNWESQESKNYLDYLLKMAD